MNLSKPARNMMITIGIAVAVITAAAAAYYFLISDILQIFPFILGLALTAGLNIIKVYMIDKAVVKSLDKEGKSAANYIRLQYLIRYLLTGAVLIAAALIPFINLWGAIAGVFTMPIAAYSLRITLRNEFKDDIPEDATEQ
ncbi:MAG: ATP synthase subunit I [Oscillospiraceae bacterium]|nr:ATP synthase subunit I [Oscillospiraceae bacterium]